MTTTTQITTITPEELTAHILAGVKEELSTFKRELQPPKPLQYISRHEVADLLGVSTVTVDTWVKKGRLTAYRIGNRVRFNRAEVEQSLTKI